MRKSAFTLAETLLTLTIIGVIAALTIPGLKEHSDEKKYIASAQKSYSTIQSATTMLETKYGDSMWWPWNNAQTITSRYKEVMNSVPYFVGDSYAIQTIDGQNWATVSQENNWFQTTDGMIWNMAAYNNTKDAVGAIYVDTNGNNLPNVVGVDVMGFVATPDGIYPMNDKMHDENSELGCTYYVIKTGKMPWLQDSSYTSCSDERINKI